jgi:hypothetical protein
MKNPYFAGNRSSFCHLITDFHSVRQTRLARYDLLGMAFSAFMAGTLVEFVRLLVSK